MVRSDKPVAHATATIPPRPKARASTPTTKYKNRLYYFISEDNKRKFVADPEQYTKGLFSHL